MAKPTQILKAGALTLGHLPVPKARRPRFELTLRISDLNNVPLVSGNCFIKWHLPSSTAAEHRGRTQKTPIKEHKVNFDYEHTIPVRLVVGKDQFLQETCINFEVLQEYSSGGKGERLALGNIKLNLAEYVDASEHSHSKEDEGITRRYLMQDSKINSTLKIGISMKHIEGDRNYIAPPLKTAPVFGGIAGIMAQEAPEGSLEDVGHMPSLSSKSREAGEMQDMYRQTLAASWVAQPGELKAHDCIEDIFSGGDGWGSHLHASKENGSAMDGEAVDDKMSRDTSATNLTVNYDHNPRSKSPKRSLGHSHRHSRGNSIDIKKKRGGGDWSAHGSGGLSKQGIFGGRTSLYQQARRVEMDRFRHPKERTNEVDEFNNAYREDLRAWKIDVDALA